MVILSVTVSAGSATGLISGLTTGSAIITYKLPTGCYITTPETVLLPPTTIAGPTEMCMGYPATFTEVATMLNEAVIGLAGRETAIGDAIAVAVKRLREQPEGQRVLVLLTDGQNTAGALDPIAAAKLAAQSGVRVYTIGIGGGEVGIRTPFGMRLLRQGNDFDPTTLKQIAETTGGRFFAATNLEQLEAVYAELDQLEPNERDQRTFRPQRSLFVWPASAALLLTVGLALGSVVRPVVRLRT